jgi:hypothetical protein
MGIFDRRPHAPQETLPAYQPIVDMRAARPAVFSLAHAMALNDAEVRAAIANLVRLSGRPSLARAVEMARVEPDVLDRPWIWLAAVMRQADKSGDYHLAVAALFWCTYWTAMMVPKIENSNPATFAELELDPIPAILKREIQVMGLASASQLPEDFVIAGDDTGRVNVGQIVELATTLLCL